MKLIRRAMLFLALYLIFSGAAAEERLCVVTDDLAALLDRDGAEIIPPGVYDDLFSVVDGTLYAAGEPGAYALCDAFGRLLTEPAYEMFSAMDDVVLFRQDGLFGAMTMEGEILQSAQWTRLVPTADGRFFALRTNPLDDSADVVWMLSPNEEPVSTGVRTASGLAPLADDRMPFRAPDTELFGYLDSNGRVTIPAQYDYAGSFEDGLARASMDGKFGIISVDGSWIIRPEYDFLELGDGIFVGLSGRELCVVYDAANCVERFRVEGVNLRVAAVGSHPIVVDDSGMSLYSADGELLLRTAANSTIAPGAEEELILSDGDWGSHCVVIIHPDGTLSERRDQHLLPLDENRYAFMTMTVATYYSDALQSIRYSCDYDSMRFGMMDAAGNEIIPAEFTEIRRLALYRYLTIAPDFLRVIDENGNVLWQYELKEE